MKILVLALAGLIASTTSFAEDLNVIHGEVTVLPLQEGGPLPRTLDCGQEVQNFELAREDLRKMVRRANFVLFSLRLLRISPEFLWNLFANLIRIETEFVIESIVDLETRFPDGTFQDDRRLRIRWALPEPFVPVYFKAPSFVWIVDQGGRDVPQVDWYHSDGTLTLETRYYPLEVCLHKNVFEISTSRQILRAHSPERVADL